jgi:hypothetical protein
MQLQLIRAIEHQIPQFFSFDTFHVVLVILGSLSVVVFFTILGPAHAQELIGFYTNLTGIEEVPPINTTASGLAVLLYNNESSQLSYLVNVTGLEKISQSSIHNGTRGINGDVVIPLKGNETADKKEIASILFQDDMKVNDLQGPLKDKKITDLVKLMSNESAYVNILTERNPGGEIRGQLNMGQIQLDPTGSITGLVVPGGVVKLTGVVLRNGVIIIETTRTIGFVPAPDGENSPINTGGVVAGVTSVVGELGGVVGIVGGTVTDVTNIIDESDGVVGKVGGTVVNTVDNAGGTVEKVGETVQETGGSVEQASSAVVETVDDTGNTLGNTVQKIDDGVVKKILIGDDEEDEDDDSGDSKDSDDEDDDSGDSKDSDDDKDDDDKDSDDDKDDDGGHSLKDTVKKLLS